MQIMKPSDVISVDHVVGLNSVPFVPSLSIATAVKLTMSLDFARRIVSGRKARFEDAELGADLDLVYGQCRRLSLTLSRLTTWHSNGSDYYHGLPSYRFRKPLQEPSAGRFEISECTSWTQVVDLESVRRTLPAVALRVELNMLRCPLYENAYAAEAMEGRVSRYPFPDHHAPPLPLLPLAVREMTAWLEGDPERVAIIHCKAGSKSVIGETL